MNEPRVLVVMFTGGEIPQVVIERFGRQIASFCNGENIKVRTLNADDIANAITKQAYFDVDVKNIIKLDKTTPEDNAIIYIGHKFSEIFNKYKSTDDININIVRKSDFRLALIRHIFIEKDENLITAIKVLSETTSPKINKHTLAKFNMIKDDIITIREVKNELIK